ncbi:MAG: DMT family transporter [Eubacteriales bacterium]|nr:DMT family transporter [Eubacteriales bacterium]
MNKGKGLIILAAFFWGVSPIFYRTMFYRGFDGISVAAMRAYSASLIFIFYGLWKGLFFRIDLKDILFFGIYGILSIGGMSLFYSLAISKLPLAMVSMLLYTAPAFVIILSKAIYNDPITKLKVISLVFTFVGCALVVKVYSLTDFAVNLVGILLGLMSGICYSGFTLFGKKGLKKYSPEINTLLPTIFSCLLFLMLRPPSKLLLDSVEIVAVFWCIGIFGSVLPFFLYLKGLNMGVDGGQASIIAYIEPVTATMIGSLFFHENLELLQLLGIFIVILSTYFVLKDSSSQMDKVLV